MREKLIGKEISSREIVNAHLEIIDKKEKNINAFITITEEEALNKADEIDKKIKKWGGKIRTFSWNSFRN